MRRGTGWVLAGAIAVVVIGGGAALWVSQGSTDPPASTPAPSPVVTSAAPVAEQAQDELDALLTACAESTAAAPPEHCGIRIPWGTEFASVTGIRYRIETMPTLVLDGGAFVAQGGVLVATVTGTGQDGAARTETYRTEDWTVRGDAVVDADGVELNVW